MNTVMTTIAARMGAFAAKTRDDKLSVTLARIANRLSNSDGLFENPLTEGERRIASKFADPEHASSIWSPPAVLTPAHVMEHVGDLDEDGFTWRWPVGKKIVARPSKAGVRFHAEIPVTEISMWVNGEDDGPAELWVLVDDQSMNVDGNYTSWVCTETMFLQSVKLWLTKAGWPKEVVTDLAYDDMLTRQQRCVTLRARKLATWLKESVLLAMD